MDAYSRHDDVSPGDIAIVGMALRVPGANSIDAFWNNLRDGVESIRDLTDEEIEAARASGDPVDQKNYVRRTGDLGGMEMFDADFFGMSPKEAAIMDPQHRHFLECAWEAMEDAGRTPGTLAGPVGVFAGCGMGSYFYFNVCSNRQLVDQVGMFLLRHTGNDKDFLSTRVSFGFDLRGPSVNVQTACSTSLVAAHYACQSLINGECDMALAGGVTIEFPHRRGYVFQEGEILSPDGRCRPFDHRSAGTVFGSGTGVVVLRRLSDAIADGDNIHAVIKGSAVNNDGAGKAGYLAPSVNGQAEAIIEAQGLAGIDAETIGYIECHGTGTPLGDPIEIEALTQAFRQSTTKTGFCGVGSVKSNIGHLDTAAGVVGLIKAVLAVKHGEIPPSLGYEKDNPAIDFARSPFFVNGTLRGWPSIDGKRRAAINSLGVGGTNAHMIVEQPPERARAAGRRSDEPQLILLSAKNGKAADASLGRLAAALTADAELGLDEVTHTLHVGRKHFASRRVVAAASREDAIAVLDSKDSRRVHAHEFVEGAGDPVFMFPGGGAQHPGMARELYEHDADFRASVDEGLGYLPPETASKIRDLWLGERSRTAEAAHALLQPSLQLPAIVICEIALARLWIKWGIEPSALIGHSMGENAAACVSGVLSYRDVVNLVLLRGQLFETVERSGMLSVPADHATVAALLPPELDIASVNAPDLCVVSGRNDDLEKFHRLLGEKGIDAIRVQIDIAAHSRLIDGILGRYEAFLRSIELKAPRIPIVSNRDGKVLADRDATDPLYWVGHLRSTVEFAKGMATLAENGKRVYIEVGPGRTLSSLAKAQGSIDANRVVNSLPHPEDSYDDRLHFTAAVGRAWAVGLEPKLDRLWAGKAVRRVSLPTYPFQHKTYFIEPAKLDQRAQAGEAVLRRLPEMEDWGFRRVWKRSVADYSPGAEAVADSWLIFLDEGGRGLTLTQRLRALGHRVATVKLGDCFAAHEDDYVLCPEDGKSGYDALVGALRLSGLEPRNVVHLWLLTDDETFRPGSNFFGRNQECGFQSLLHFAQAIADAGETGELSITVATNGMQRVAGEAVPYPEKSTVLGPALVIPKELAGTKVRTVDFELAGQAAASGGLFGRKRRDDAPDALIDQLWEEVLAPAGNEVVAWRDGKRWLLAYAKLPLAGAEPDKPSFRREGVYLFTGGLGDLALAMATQLAREYAARVVLVGRAALPPREEWPAVRRMLARGDRLRRAIDSIVEMEALGAEVLYAQADVADATAMAAAFDAAAQRFGRIDGVLHAAGSIDDGLLQTKTSSGMEAVLAPKIYGTLVLDEILAERDVDFLVLFSSTSTDTAPAGQVDYVAANAFLNAYAESRAGNAARRTVALHWGVWAGVGMAARATEADDRDAAVDPVREPVAAGSPFEHFIEDEEGYSWLEVAVGPGKHWVLDEHRLATGQAVYPGTGYVDLVLKAAAGFGLPATGRISDLMFLRPLSVGESETKSLRVRFERQNGDHYRVTVASADDSGRLTEHVHAVYRPEHGAKPTEIDLHGIAARCADIRQAESGKALRTSQEVHLRFGPRWQVLRSLRLGEGEALAELSLAASFHADADEGVVLHPALLDIATGCAMEIVPGYDAREALWVPAGYSRITVHRPLPNEIRSWIRSANAAEFGEGYAAFDVTITDAAGHAVVDVARLLVKKLPKDEIFIDASEPPARPVTRRAQSPALEKLAAQVRNGIHPHEGVEALQRALASGETQPIVSSMDLEELRAQAAAPMAETVREEGGFERPELDSDYVEPRDEVEEQIAGFWRELLGLQRVGVHDSFFDVGGHSLIAVRLFRMIKNTFGVDLPISTLFDAPTIAQCAALLPRDQSAADAASSSPAGEQAAPVSLNRFTHLVALHPGGSNAATPLFVCAGMFGNVLNLRHLALHLGRDRPVYALQARGLFGDEAPHETFEEMARDYLAEVRSVQPHGPYILAGFSGGGIVALEMAQQLTEAGEDVSHLIMLDTPLPTQPPLSPRDKLSMKMQDIRRQGPMAPVNWVRNKIQWKLYKKRMATAGAGEDSSAETFHDLAIEAAFRGALLRYTLRPYGGDVLLLKPKPQVYYHLSGGRRLHESRDIILDDNGWSPIIANMTVLEVPGDHDSMVLEPCVRVMTERIRGWLPKPDEPFVHRVAAE